MHRLASLTSTGLGTVAYGYDDYGKLTTITRGSTTYSLTYDAWNRPISTKVGTTALSTNTYDSDFRLSTVTYANGFSARYVYDDLDRVRGIYQTENNTESFVYSFIYNGEGDLYELRNYRTHRASFFEYDHAGRCVASKERAFTVTNGRITYGTNLSSYGYQYDECNNLTKLTCSVAGSIWNTVYTYDSDNRPKTTTLNSGKVITNTYDAIGRLSKRTIGLSTPYETRFEYHLNGSNRTPLLHKYYNGSDDPFVYNYDDNGNIISITQGSTSISYKYDAANRLTRENNGVLNQTITYQYDAWGNILNKKFYAYTTATNPGTPTGTINYAYGNTAWGDQLTSYAGQTITYDSMGNPLSYRGYTMAWRGKQLTSADNGTVSATFEYNEDGLRQKKTVNNISTDYYYNGSVLIGMQRGSTKYLFSYDASGNVVSVKIGTDEYYYIRNAQGDVIKLIDASGVSVVEYTYDTWGKAVTTTGTLAGTLGLFQPFRYRGYVYDFETGFYYLQSRYYDPTVGRFISADILLSTGQGVLGHNCYAYCGDNPVSRVDANGKDWVSTFTEWIEKTWDALKDGFSCAYSSIKDSFVDLWHTLTRFHYEDRELHNGQAPSYEEISALDSGWYLLPPELSKYHDNKKGKDEEKYVHPDGREFVYDGDTHKLITDPKLKGTFNYCPTISPKLKKKPFLTDSIGHLINSVGDYAKYGIECIGHFFADMLPYYILGNERSKEE